MANAASTVLNNGETDYLLVILVPVGFLVAGVISMLIYLACHYRNKKKLEKPCSDVVPASANLPKELPSSLINASGECKQSVEKQSSVVREVVPLVQLKTPPTAHDNPLKKISEQKKPVEDYPKKVDVAEGVDRKIVVSNRKVVLSEGHKTLPEIMQADKTTVGDLGCVSVIRDDQSMKSLLREVDTRVMPRIGRAAYAEIIDEVFDQQDKDEAKEPKKKLARSGDLDPRVSVDMSRSVIYVMPSEFTQESETTQSSQVPFSDSAREPMLPNGQIIRDS